jgi:hypothetical protein
MQMMVRKLFVVGALLPIAAFAQEFDYTFVEVSYMDTELDAGPGDIAGDGLGVSASLSLTDDVFLFGGYDTQDFGFGIDASTYDFGAGMRWGLNPQVDIVGDLAWVHTQVDTGFASADDDGLGLGLGLRGRMSDSIELQGGLRYVDLDDSDTFLSLGGRWHFTEIFAASFGLDFNDDISGWSLGLRAEFE